MLTIGLWICVSISSAVTSGLRTLSRSSFQLNDQAAEWFQQYKDSRGGRVITWDDFRRDFRAHHIPQSVVGSKREEFRNLKQGSWSVYDYNKLFQKLARFAKQDVPDEKSMIYQFRVVSEKKFS